MFPHTFTSVTETVNHIHEYTNSSNHIFIYNQMKIHTYINIYGAIKTSIETKQNIFTEYNPTAEPADIHIIYMLNKTLTNAWEHTKNQK